MKKRVLQILFVFVCIILYACSGAETNSKFSEGKSLIYSQAELDQMTQKPVDMGEYQPSQAGPLRKPDGMGGFTYDSTFTVEKVRIKSEGYLITGWLYLPKGNGRCPLIILTNGGGNIVRSIRSFSDFMAPLLAHCG